MSSRPAARPLKLSDRFDEIKDPWSQRQLSGVRGRPAVSPPPVERAAGMADSERPHLTQADPKFLGHLEKRVLVIELGDPHTGRVA
jgi:hypothetical protein